MVRIEIVGTAREIVTQKIVLRRGAQPNSTRRPTGAVRERQQRMKQRSTGVRVNGRPDPELLGSSVI